MTPYEARELVESIRIGLGDLAERIRLAYEGRAWVALGYDSWSLLCQQEFGGGFQLPSGKRREVVAELTAAGMSSRAIGNALGVDHSQVVRTAPPKPAKVIGLDGKRYTPPAPRPTPPPLAPEFGSMLTALNTAVCAVLDHETAELAAAPLYVIQGLRASCADLARRLDDAERTRKDTAQ